MTDRSAFVVEARLGEPDTVRLHPRARLEAHPFANRVTVQRDRDIGVDPRSVREAQRIADPAADAAAVGALDDEFHRRIVGAA